MPHDDATIEADMKEINEIIAANPIPMFVRKKPYKYGRRIDKRETEEQRFARVAGSIYRATGQ